jgi:hypothetical protein
LQRDEQRRVAVCDRNWKLGNWFVRGFSLETTTNETRSEHWVDTIPIPSVSTIVTSSSSASDQYESDTDIDFDTNTFQNQIDVWVGRTDGRIFGIRFGTDYWTRLGSSSSSSDEIEVDDTSTVTDVVDDFDVDEDNDSEVTLPSEPTEVNPFTIVTQFQCTGSSEVTSIVAIPKPASSTDNPNDEEGDDWMQFDIYVAGKDHAAIEHWYYDGHSTTSKQSLFDTQASNNEISSIHILRQMDTVVNNVPTATILSVRDSRMTLWDIQTNTIIGSIDTAQIPDSPSSSSFANLDAQRIICIDTDNEFIYVGTESGYVLVYAVSDIIRQSNQLEPLSMISAVGCWRAAPTDDCAITAIQCGGPGTLGRNSATTTSTILYTGDAQGLVKQWEVLKMETSSSLPSDNDRVTKYVEKKYKVEAWPKLSTQRLPKKAHVFVGHYAAITGLLSVDALKFVSASADGTGMFVSI